MRKGLGPWIAVMLVLPAAAGASHYFAVPNSADGFGMNLPGVGFDEIMADDGSEWIATGILVGTQLSMTFVRTDQSQGILVTADQTRLAGGCSLAPVFQWASTLVGPLSVHFEDSASCDISAVAYW